MRDNCTVCGEDRIVYKFLGLPTKICEECFKKINRKKRRQGGTDRSRKEKVKKVKGQKEE